MSLRSTYKTDEAKELEGVTIKLPPNDDGTVPYFVVTRMLPRTNKRYAKALERVMRPHQAAQRTKTLNEDVAASLVMEAFIDGCLLSWGNIELADVTGNEDDTGFANFNKDNATKLFTRMPDLLLELQSDAMDISLFRTSSAEESAKN